MDSGYQFKFRRANDALRKKFGKREVKNDAGMEDLFFPF